MKRAIWFILFLPVCVHAWDLPGLGSFKFEKVGANVYIMHGPLSLPNKQNKGFMNNPGIIITGKGVILIDPGSTYQVGKKVLEEIGKITKKPVIAIFNTHIHGDHWLANYAIKEVYPKVRIYGHRLMIQKANGQAGLFWIDLMDKMTEGESRGTKIVAPGHVSKHGDTLTIGGQHLRIHSLGRAHTDNDIMIEHVESKTLFLGDNSFNKRMGQFDNSSSMYGVIKVLKYARGLDIKTFIPGHGKSGSFDFAVKPFLDYLQKLQVIVKSGYEKGLENYEIKPVAANVLHAYKDWAGFDEIFGKHVSKMFLEVEARNL